MSVTDTREKEQVRETQNGGSGLAPEPRSPGSRTPWPPAPGAAFVVEWQLVPFEGPR